MIRSLLRMVAIAALGTGLGLAWNILSGRGIALDRNAYVRDEDEVIEPPEARTRFEKGALFLDAREAEVYRDGHVPGALSLPENDFQKAFPRHEPLLRSRFDLVIYCSGIGCEASHTVARWLRQRGIQAAIFVKGWPAWTQAGLPVRKGEAP